LAHGRITPHRRGLGLEELKSLLVQALEDVARLKAENEALREEMARLKGLNGRPKLKPSGMEKATETPAKVVRKIGRRGAKRSKLTINETRTIKAENVPAGARWAMRSLSSRISWCGR
jgi:hypothetical protein